MLSIEQINALTFETKLSRCQHCTNHCLLTINQFNGGRRYITGNRCERGIGQEKTKSRSQTCTNTKAGACLTISRFLRKKRYAEPSAFQGY